MDPIMEIARKHNLRVIEDCAHALETQYHGHKAGSFGDFGCFSFYATKNVVTGEGGMIVGRDEAPIARAKVLALHGMSKDAWHRFGDKGYKHYEVVEAGFKYNMMDLQAAIGIHQMAGVEANWRRRKEIWSRYQVAFADLPIEIPGEPDPDTRHAYHLYTILVDENRCGVSRDSFLDAMNASRIGAGVHYMSVPEHPYYQNRFGWRPERSPNAMRVGRQTVSLPLSPKLTDADVERVSAAVRKIISREASALPTIHPRQSQPANARAPVSTQLAPCARQGRIPAAFRWRLVPGPAHLQLCAMRSAGHPRHWSNRDTSRGRRQLLEC